MQHSSTDPFVSVGWLKAHQTDPNVVVLDATYTMAGSEPPSPESFIPGAQVFDVDEIADNTAQFSHTLPDSEAFETACDALGITNTTPIVAYDRHGLFSAPRAWWMFRVFGHDAVKVLDGGLPAWIRADNEVVSKAASVTPSKGYRAKFRPNLFASKSDVLSQLGQTQMFDARPPARFNGSVPDPRPGVDTGHMPGASSVPFGSLKTDAGFIKDEETLRQIFAPFDLSKPAITTCGSGITACGIAIALARIGKWDARIYDGSWVEWGSDPTLPVETTL